MVSVRLKYNTGNIICKNMTHARKIIVVCESFFNLNCRRECIIFVSKRTIKRCVRVKRRSRDREEPTKKVARRETGTLRSRRPPVHVAVYTREPVRTWQISRPLGYRETSPRELEARENRRLLSSSRQPNRYRRAIQPISSRGR